MINNEFLNRAIGGIDDDLIADAKFAAVKRRSAVLMRIVPIAAAVAILAAGVIATFSMANRNKPEVPGADEPIVVPPVGDTDTTADEPILVPPVVDTDGTTEDSETEENPVLTEPPVTDVEQGHIEGIYEIYGSNAENVGKMSGAPATYVRLQCVSLKMSSCISKKETIILNVTNGFLTSNSNEDGAVLPVFIAYKENIGIRNKLPEKYGYNSKNDTSSLLVLKIDGAEKHSKVYNLDDFINLRITTTIKVTKDKETGTTYFDMDLPGQEKIYADFSGVSEGSIGRIVIRTTWTDFPDSSKNYNSNMFLYYCVGKDYVGFSFQGTDDAIKNLAKVEYGDFESEEEIAEYLKALFA